MKTARLIAISASCTALLFSTSASAQGISVVPLVPTQQPDEKTARKPPKKPGKRAQQSKQEKKPEPAHPAEIALRGPVVPLKAGESTTIHIKVLDQVSQPIAATISLTADTGTITTPVAMGVGQYLATYAAPADAAAGAQATISATLEDAPKPVQAELAIAFAGEAPRPEVTELIAHDDDMHPDIKAARIVFKEPVEVRPGQTATLRFRVLDEDDEPVSLEGVELEAENGTLSEPEDTGDSYVIKLMASEDARGEIPVRARAAGKPLRGEGMVVVTEPGFVPEPKRLGFGVTAFAGGLTSFGEITAPEFELALELRHSSGVSLGVLGGFSPAGAQDVAATNGAQQADFSLSIIPLLARAGYTTAVGPVEIGFGGMAGVALVKGEARAASSTRTFSETPLDLGVFANVGVPLGPGAAMLEMRMSRIKLDHQEDDGFIVQGFLGGLSGAVGYRLQL